MSPRAPQIKLRVGPAEHQWFWNIGRRPSTSTRLEHRGFCGAGLCARHAGVALGALAVRLGHMAVPRGLFG